MRRVIKEKRKLLKLLKNRKIAIIITVIVVIFATLFGVSRSLNNLARNVEAIFYDGVFINDVPQRSISHHLDVIEQAVLNTVPAFNNYPALSDEVEALTVARRELLGAGSIPEKFTAYMNIQSASTRLISKAESVELSQRDQDILDQYQTTLTRATIAIQSSEYNVRARGFMDGSSFIAYTLRPFVFVTAPQAFD